MSAPATPEPLAWSPMKRRLYGLAFGSPLYRLALSGSVPASLAAKPADPWPGDARAGLRLIEGTYAFEGHRATPAGSPWDEAAPPRWRDALEGFVWLRDLRADGGDAARGLAQRLTADWLTRYDRWSWPSWRADLIGRRLSSWIAHFDIFFQSAADGLRAEVLQSMAQQSRHLQRVAGRETDGAKRLAAIRGLVYAGIALPSQQSALGRGCELLTAELARQFAPDGAHIEHSPLVQYEVLRDLIAIRETLSIGGQGVPLVLTEAIRRAGRMLRALCHGDGGLALFNGAAEGEPGALQDTVARCGLQRRRSDPPADSGFQRLEAGRTVVLLDAAAPPPEGLDSCAHAGTLSLEVSHGRSRLLVNCGPAPADDPAWNVACRATAAHSTLAIDDTNSSEISAAGRLGRRVERVICRRESADGAVWVDAVHDGYAVPFGLHHRRRLYLSAAGDDLRGEDTLEPVPGMRVGDEEVSGYPIAVRFHLHPDVRVSLAQGRQTALLGVPKGAGWRLRATGATLSLADSIYTGDGQEVRNTQQIVLTGVTHPGVTTIKWALRQEG